VAAFAATREIAEAMTVDAEDGVVVAGRSEQPPMTSDFALTRFGADGRLDPAFGSSGLAVTDFFGMDDVAQAVAVDHSGRLVTFGRAQTSPGYSEAGFALALARYTSDGLLDPAFGAGGATTTSLALPMAWWGSVAIDAAGRIVVAGAIGHTGVVGRYLSDDGPTARPVDIKPGDPANRVSLAARGRLDVALLSTADWVPASAIDTRTLTFGRTGAERSLLLRKDGSGNCSVKDVSDDNRPDLVCGFLVKLADFRIGDATGVLRGSTHAGAAFEGRDAILVVP
jgi:uncharacterized delta-60 repeat protein